MIKSFLGRIVVITQKCLVLNYHNWNCYNHMKKRIKSCIIVFAACNLYAILYQIYEGKILNEDTHK